MNGCFLNSDCKGCEFYNTYSHFCMFSKASYLRGRADATKEIKAKAHCEYADCFECAFGSAEGCLLKEKEHE